MHLPRTANKRMSSILRHRVVIEERTKVSDGEGGFTQTWSTVSGYGSVPVAVWPIFAFQKGQFRNVDAEATHYFIFRGEIDFNRAQNRIVFGSRIFEIIAVEDIQERGIKKQVTTKEVIK